MKNRKKLIEVALPLDAINKASAREKSIRHGHPSTLHLWWARRPLAAARAVIFAQMVDDPSTYVDTLLSDPMLKRHAESELRQRQAAWQERGAKHKEAQAEGDTNVPEAGAKPTLEGCIADIERQRLFRIIEDLVQWENTTNETVLERARAEIWQSWRRACAENADHPRAKESFGRNKLPAFHDPFAGGGSLPLEAQRLGLESYASDLNPVAVLICKAMIEIPPKFAGKPPVNPEARKTQTLPTAEDAEDRKGKEMDIEEGSSPLRPSASSAVNSPWRGARGLAEDVRYYGQWMRDEAEKRIGHLYPKIEITVEMARGRPDLKPLVGRKLTVIAWLWARTVKSPNPAFAQADVPLASTFMLSTKPGKEAYIEPVIEDGSYRFTVKMGKPKDVEAGDTGTKAGKKGGFRCLLSGVPIPFDYLRTEASAGRMSERLMAVVAEGDTRRLYLPPTPEMEAVAYNAEPTWLPNTETFGKCRVNIGLYGVTTWDKLFTPRQLVALTTLADLVHEAREHVKCDALAAGLPDNGRSIAGGGTGVSAYADAVGVMLGMAVSRSSNTINAFALWSTGREQSVNLFSRQAIAMTWDFPDVNPFAGAAGDFAVTCNSMARVIEACPASVSAWVEQRDARIVEVSDKVVSTDPPYFDNISYADLSDFFYVWMRRALKPIYPDLFTTLAAPKAEELVATPYRHGGKEKAEAFFLKGMTLAMQRLAEQSHPAFPVTIYYAFKQSESEGEDGTASTGWETFLDAVIQAGFSLSGTWPMRTERPTGVKVNFNALASSIILVCRPRAPKAPTATRREFVTTLKAELPVALAHLQRGNIAPVDLAQAAIGPGMAVYTRYSKVLDAEGKPLSVRAALALINQTLDEALTEQEGDFDADSRWALAWFEQSGFGEGEYGVAETLSKAKNTSVGGMVEAGILAASHGKVRLLRPDELPTDWDPVADPRLTAWEMVHQLIRTLEAGGESAAAELAAKLGSRAETARELCYRLYTICERKKRAAEALSYNGLVQSWPEITRLAREGGKSRAAQDELPL